MAPLRSVFNNRYAVFFWAVMECLLFSAIVYGWASLVHILKKEGFFRDSCADNFNTTNENQKCIPQDELLNLAFTVGVFSFTSFGIVAGALLYHTGPRVTRLAAWLVNITKYTKLVSQQISPAKEFEPFRWFMIEIIRISVIIFLFLRISNYLLHELRAFFGN